MVEVSDGVSFDDVYEKILEKHKDKKYKPKPAFFSRIARLLKNARDVELFFDKCYEPMLFSIRANTLKISIEKLRQRLEQKWQIEWLGKYGLEEGFVIKTRLEPGALGNSLEHVLGYYYVQSISSMLPAKVLMPQANSLVLDCCAAPGSKTTHLAAIMANSGLIVANDISWERGIALASNLQRCGVINAILTTMPFSLLAKNLISKKLSFDYILVDAPCSNEGTIRKNQELFKLWSEKTIKRLSRIQKGILARAIGLLKNDGILVYSTCTLAPEENEEVIDYVLRKFPLRVEKIKLKIPTRQGISEWQGKSYSKEIKKAIRIMPQDFDSEGFFIAKLRLEK
ncbi:MAG: RsmB/NOP family class I SAM-dependent RNA methyltransferase [Candidatus Pacearchaeota archaeon]